MPEIVCIARTGDPAPDGIGTLESFVSFDSFLNSHFAPALNSNGEVAFWAAVEPVVPLRCCSGRDPCDELSCEGGVFRGAAEGPLIQIARIGNTTTPETWLDLCRFGSPGLNNHGQVAFYSVSYDVLLWRETGCDYLETRSDIIRGNGHTLARMLPAEGEPVDDGTEVITPNGDVAMQAIEDGRYRSYSKGIYLSSGKDRDLSTKIVNWQDSPPGSTLFFGDMCVKDVNVGGEVLFYSDLVHDPEDFESPPAGGGLWVGAGGALTTIAILGDEAPDGSVIEEISGGVLTTGGMVAFCSHREAGGNPTAVLRRTPRAGIIQIAGQRQAAPDGNGTFDCFSAPRINGTGQSAFWAQLEGTRGGSDDSRGIYLGMGRDLTQIVRSGQVTPEGVGRFSLDNPYLRRGSIDYPLSIGIEGQVAFWSELDGGSAEGIYIGNGTDLIKVVRSGDRLDGGEVSRLLFSYRGDSSRQGFNAIGQVAFVAEFTDGTQGVYLYTPDIHVGPEIDVPDLTAWDWPLDIPPGEVHEVFIDPAKDVEVGICDKEVRVKKLTIGGGKGKSTVTMKDGKVSTIDGVNIAWNGVLTGTGMISGNVENQGKISPEKIDVDGDLKNKGKIDGQTEDDAVAVSGTLDNDGEIEGSLTVGCVFNNLSKGRVRLNKGDKMHFRSTENSNSGLIAVDDATLRFKSSLENSTRGRIMANQAKLLFEGGLLNSGLLSANCSRVYGDIVNRSTGKIASYGDIVYEGDIKTFGTINNDAHSRSIFRGRLSAMGQLSGRGRTLMEGTFEPGARKGIVVEGDLVFADKCRTILVLHEDLSAVVVDVRSVLKLGGKLEVAFSKDFKFSDDDVLTIFRAKEIRGKFHEVILPKIDGYQFKMLSSQFRYSLLVSAQ